MFEILGIGVIFAIIIIASFVYDMFSWGFVFYKFWYWFVLPVFNTHTVLNMVNPLPEITFYQSIGLVCFTMLISHRNVYLVKKEYKDETTSTIINIISPWIIFIIGWATYAWFVKP
jgi:hypothetical protein